jgi:acyl-CoA thioester hydrolase
MRTPESPFANENANAVPAGVTVAPGEHLHALRVRYADSDQMGVSYYANYLVWFEVGRTEWLRARGCTYREWEARGFFLPVTEAYCRYHAPSRYDDRLYVITRLGALARVSLRFDYRVLHEDGRLTATGHTEHCFLSRDGRPVRPPQDLANLLAEAGPGT